MSILKGERFPSCDIPRRAPATNCSDAQRPLECISDGKPIRGNKTRQVDTLTFNAADAYGTVHVFASDRSRSLDREGDIGQSSSCSCEESGRPPLEFTVFRITLRQVAIVATPIGSLLSFTSPSASSMRLGIGAPATVICYCSQHRENPRARK